MVSGVGETHGLTVETRGADEPLEVNAAANYHAVTAIQLGECSGRSEGIPLDLTCHCADELRRQVSLAADDEYTEDDEGGIKRWSCGSQTKGGFLGLNGHTVIERKPPGAKQLVLVVSLVDNVMYKVDNPHGGFH